MAPAERGATALQNDVQKPVRFPEHRRVATRGMWSALAAGCLIVSAHGAPRVNGGTAPPAVSAAAACLDPDLTSLRVPCGTERLSDSLTASGWSLRACGECGRTPLAVHCPYALEVAGHAVLDVRVWLHRSLVGDRQWATLPRGLLQATARSGAHGRASAGGYAAPAFLACPSAEAPGMPPSDAWNLGDERAAGIAADLLHKPPDQELALSRAWLWEGDSLRAVYAATAADDASARDLQIILDGQTGRVLGTRDLRQNGQGRGLVFSPNPVSASGNRSLRDGDDLDAYRVAVTLEDLDGSGFLSGQWARIENPAGNAFRADRIYEYASDDLHFEEVMAYYHITAMQNSIRSLGFLDLQARPQAVVVHATALDESWFSPLTSTISFGDGDVDDAEDADVILHEYGHALYYAVAGGCAHAEAAAVSEGFADYLAASHTGDACIGDWDGVAYAGGCLRDLTNPRRYPTDLCGEPHNDGLILSTLLWRIRQRTEARLTDLLALESLYGLTPTATLKEAARGLQATAIEMEAAGLADDFAPAVEGALAEAGFLPRTGTVALPAGPLARVEIPFDFSFVAPGLRVQRPADGVLVRGDGAILIPTGDTTEDLPVLAPLPLATEELDASWCDTIGLEWEATLAGATIEERFLRSGRCECSVTARISADGSMEIEWHGDGERVAWPGRVGWFPGGLAGPVHWIVLSGPREIELASGEGVGIDVSGERLDLRGALWRIESASPDGYTARLERTPIPLPRSAGGALLVFPNPSHAGARVALRAEQAGIYQLDLLDAGGRRLSRTWARLTGPGLHAWFLTGQDGAGRPLPGGIYTLHVVGPDFERTGRVVWVP